MRKQSEGPTHRNVRNLEISMNFADSDTESGSAFGDAQRTTAFQQARCKYFGLKLVSRPTASK